jgi:hypothetical protein
VKRRRRLKRRRLLCRGQFGRRGLLRELERLHLGGRNGMHGYAIRRLRGLGLGCAGFPGGARELGLAPHEDFLQNRDGGIESSVGRIGHE